MRQASVMPPTFLYNLLILKGLLWAWPLLAAVGLASAKRRANLLPRLGRTDRELAAALARNPRPVWFHALSVGEVLSALPLVEAFRRTCPAPAVLSTTTVTGQALAGERLSAAGMPLFYFPVDLPFAVRRVGARVAPAMVVIVETDLWPNFLYEMQRRRVPVLLVNARLSPDAFKRYQRLGSWGMRFLSTLARIGCQGGQDADRYLRLGVPAGKVTVTGNLKYDRTVERMDTGQTAGLRRLLGLAAGKPIVLAGSTHAGEEEVVREAFVRLRARQTQAALVVVPRDPRRGQAVAALFRQAGLAVRRLSGGNGPGLSEAVDVAVVDCIGLLGRLYGLADVAFVGGSLVAEGGHNPLEPAALAKPIVFGPDMSDFQDIAAALRGAGAAATVTDGPSMAVVVGRLLANPTLAGQMGRAALRVFQDNQGAVARTLDIIEEVAGGWGEWKN
jgi:3-deoxy-D-manno-octulosonic-acid transferase